MFNGTTSTAKYIEAIAKAEFPKALTDKAKPIIAIFPRQAPCTNAPRACLSTIPYATKWKIIKAHVITQPAKTINKVGKCSVRFVVAIFTNNKQGNVRLNTNSDPVLANSSVIQPFLFNKIPRPMIRLIGNVTSKA